MSGSVGKALRVLVLTLLFLLASCVTLAAGILLGQDLVVAASIVLSLVAAALLIVAIRQQREVVPATANEKAGRRRVFDDPPSVSPGPERVMSQQSLTERTSFAHRERDESDVEATMLLPRVNPATRTETHHSVVPPLPPLTEQARLAWDEQETVKQASVLNHASEPVVSSSVAAAEPGHTSELTQILDSEESGETQVIGKTSSVEQATIEQQALLNQEIGASTLGEEPVEEEFDDPPDEPAAELLLSSEERRVAQLNDDVMVVDGRPRYHVSGCAHLADKASQPLPASEAVELGFTPCSACSAATTLLTHDS